VNSADRVLAALGALADAVPGASVAAKPRGGAVRQLLRASRTGRADSAEAVIRDGVGQFTLRYPNDPDVDVDALVEVVAVALAMRTRFGQWLAHAKLISIDHSSHGFRTHTTAGEAANIVGDVHLNATSFLPDPDRGREPRRAGVVGETTAHELWHQVEMAFLARRYRDSIEFRRQVGAYFGVETLEHAVERAGPAHDKLVAEVSAYAGTKAIEATAELARVWWATRAWDDPPPVAAHFGAVVDRFFPPPLPPGAPSAP
jgi:hypothetical protein